MRKKRTQGNVFLTVIIVAALVTTFAVAYLQRTQTRNAQNVSDRTRDSINHVAESLQATMGLPSTFIKTFDPTDKPTAPYSQIYRQFKACIDLDANGHIQDNACTLPGGVPMEFKLYSPAGGVLAGKDPNDNAETGYDANGAPCAPGINNSGCRVEAKAFLQSISCGPIGSGPCTFTISYQVGVAATSQDVNYIRTLCAPSQATTSCTSPQTFSCAIGLGSDGWHVSNCTGGPASGGGTSGSGGTTTSSGTTSGGSSTTSSGTTSGGSSTTSSGTTSSGTTSGGGGTTTSSGTTSGGSSTTSSGTTSGGGSTGKLTGLIQNL